jgi:hypothetical protein
MAGAAPDNSNVWEDIEKILGPHECPAHSNHKPTDSSDESSDAETEPVLHSKATTNKQKTHSLRLQHNCVSNSACLPDPVQESFRELLELVRCMGFKLEFVEGLQKIQDIDNAMQADWNGTMCADISRLNPMKALLCFKDSINTPDFLSLITAKVLARIALILAHVYNQWQHAFSFCDQAHICFERTPNLCTELRVEQAFNCFIASTSCEKMMQTFSAREWAHHAVNLLRVSMASISEDHNVLRKVAFIYNQCAVRYHNAGKKEDAMTCLEMAYNVYRIINFGEGMQVVRLNIQIFSR